MEVFYLLAFVTSVALGVSSSLTLVDPRNSFTQFEKWEASNKGSRLWFRFKTYVADCFLLYQDADEGRAVNVLAIDLSGGKLRISVNPEAESRVLKLGEHLNDLRWHTVVVERINGRMVTISLDGVLNKTLSSRVKSWKTATSLYFGGVPSSAGLDGKTLVLPSVINKNRFIGCMEGPAFSHDLQGSVRIATLLDSKGVVKGCMDFCVKGRFRCENAGTFVNRFIAAECDSRHTVFEGSRCHHESPVVNLQEMDYVTYKIPPVTTRQDRITFRFKTAKSDGVVLETSFYHDFLVVELRSGSVHVTWNLGDEDLGLTTGHRTYDDDTWHYMDIQRHLRHITLSVDDEPRVSKNFPGRFVGFDMKDGAGKIFIGGVNPARSRMTAINKENFEGCLQKLTFNGVNVLRGLKTGAKRFSLKGNVKWNCDATVQNAVPKSPSLQTPAFPGILWEKFNTVGTQDARPPSLPSQTPCAIDDEDDDCIGGESGSGSGEASSGDTSGDESMSGSSTAAVQQGRPTAHSTPEGASSPVLETTPTACSSDDEDCRGSGEEAGGGSGWENERSSLHTPQGVLTSPWNPAVQSPNGRKVRKKNQVPAIAGIVVVSLLLVAFFVFVVIWCHKHKGKGYSLSHVRSCDNECHTCKDV